MNWFVHFAHTTWMAMSAEAASFWFIKGYPVRLDGPYTPPPTNQYGVYLTPVQLPWK